jgi:hypothetical protein
MSSELTDLVARIGTYGGHGINHADQPFHGELRLTGLPGGIGVDLELRATGIDGTEYQVERGWVAPDEYGDVVLWHASTGVPHIGKLALLRSFPSDGADRVLVFCSGEDAAVFRAEISVELWPDGSMGVRQRWAQPGADWVTRAEVRCRPVRQQAPWENPD